MVVWTRRGRISDAVDTFRNRSTDLIRRLRGKPDAVIWEYISLNDESTRYHMDTHP